LRRFEYDHVVGFAETNLVGNVYFAHFVSWQGRCREMFLRQHAPGVLADLGRDLRLVTLKTACQYFTELAAFDSVQVCMFLQAMVQNRITMRFDYLRIRAGGAELVARGEQEIACMRATARGTEPTPIPPELAAALMPYLSEAT
jgi:enediyne biosynthesis thioesterase